MKVLHAPVNIGNQPWVLSRYERKLGVESDLVVNYPPSMGYQADKIISPLGWKSEREMSDRIKYGLRAPFDYDVLHYYFGRTLMCWDDYDDKNYFPLADLDIAKRLKRPIFFTLQGCDVRIAAESTVRNMITPCREGVCDNFAACISTVDRTRREFIAKVIPQIDRVFFLNPELGHYLKCGDFLPYCSVDIHAYEATPPILDRPARIVHAPTNASIKGTGEILKALEELKGRYEFELILVQNLKHEDALKVYHEADIVIDQVLTGWYGGVAVEAMAMGKPVMCYLREEDFGLVPEDMIADMPVRSIRPGRLVEDLSGILDRRREWTAWSAISRQFVEKWHNPAVIAAAMIDSYRCPADRFNLLDHVRRAAANKR